MKKIMLVLIAFSVLQGCANKSPELKSPCVGAEDSPCGPRMPINDHWLKSLNT